MATEGGTGRAERIEEDAAELARLMPRFVRLAKAPGMLPADLRTRFEQAGLGMRHVPVLIVIAKHRSCSVGQIAENVVLTPATTSQLVGELERAGLVRREQDPADRRRAVITLPPEHQRSIEKIMARRLAMLRETLNRLTERERENFLKGWHTMIEVGEAMTGDQPSDVC